MSEYGFETERLIARALVDSDADALTVYMKERNLPRNLGRAPFPYARSDAEAFIANAKKNRQSGREYAFAIQLKDGPLIGCAGVTAYEFAWELGYWIGKPHWGKGYVTEAARGVLNWTEQTQQSTAFMAGHYQDNPASGKVLEKLGFTPVGKVLLPNLVRPVPGIAVRMVNGAPPEVSMKVGHPIPDGVNT